MVDARHQWVEITQLAADEEDFPELGEAFARTGGERHRTIGIGIARLCRSRDIVDFGVNWMLANRAR